MYKSILNILQELEQKIAHLRSFPRCHHPFTSLTSPALELKPYSIIVHYKVLALSPLNCQNLANETGFFRCIFITDMA